MSLARAITTIGGFTLISRLLGFVRDIIAAAYLGAGPINDAFLVALKLPNFFRRLFAEGAFNAAFVPLYAGALAAEGPGAAKRLAEQALAVLAAVLIPLTLLAIIFMPQLIAVLAPGFEGAQQTLAVGYSRITFSYLLMISLVALMGAVLNSHNRFGPFAEAPILFNLCSILALFGLTRLGLDAGLAASYGVAVAGIVQLVWLAWNIQKLGVPLSLPRPRLTPGVRRLLLLMGPGALGAGVVQINLMVDVIIASYLPSGAVSYLYYADRLNQLPLGMIGITIATALLPMLSRAVRAGDHEESVALMNRAAEFGLLLTLPAAIALGLIGGPILSALFVRGDFSAADADATALALSAYAIGLPAYILIKIGNTAWFARQNTRKPVVLSAIAVVANTALALALVWYLPTSVAHGGIALATGLVAWLQLAMILHGLDQAGVLVFDARFRRRLPRMILSALGMGAVCLLLSGWLSPLWQAGEIRRFLGMLLLCGGGALTYAILVQLTGAARWQELPALLRRPKGVTAAPVDND